jgi:ribosomal protein S18 acetylase RimI-like enzyme
MITYDDWRDAPADLVARLYDAECLRWARLGWDYRPSCAIVEAARHEGRLPGLLARDRGRVVGWAFYMLHEGTLQIGTLLADSAPVARGLLAAVLATPEARAARRLSCFLVPNVPGIDGALERVHFAVGRHAYLCRALTSDSAIGNSVARRKHVQPSALIASWTPEDLSDVVKLLSLAYAGRPEERWFAPNGRLQEWARYVTQLIRTPACGRFDPTLTVTARTAGGDLTGVVIVTVLGERTAHIAQVAVGPGFRRQGLGEHLVRLACERSRTEGHRRMTLLVGESNRGARRLYSRLGFTPVTSFLLGMRPGVQQQGQQKADC